MVLFNVTAARESVDAGHVVLAPMPFASGGRQQAAHAHQVVGRRGEEKLPVHPTSAAVTELAQAADRLHPAEDFFDPLPRAG